MGYYTSHSLEIIEGRLTSIDHHDQIEERVDFPVFDEATKWYEHEADMRSYSVDFPGVVFKLSGEGSDTGDLWVEYYKDGKSQREEAVITYGEYNEDKLK